MAVNNSSSTNDSLPQFSMFNSSCFATTTVYMHTAFHFTNILLLLPLSTFVLYLGFQRWKQQRFSAAVVSHSDFFTYNMAVMDLIGVVGSTIHICGSFTGLFEVMLVGVLIWVFPWYAQMLFPVLICVEHYLAVVHPITYMRVKQTGGVRIRIISTVSVWLQCSAVVAFMFYIMKYPEYDLIPTACQMALFFITTIFCCLSVLRVLIRPRPGEGGEDGARVDQSKWRAFQTIMIIMGVLLLRFGGNLVFNVISSSPTVTQSVHCVAQAAAVWCNLPSSLVLPLLFLHRAGKLAGCKRNAESA